MFVPKHQTSCHYARLVAFIKSICHIHVISALKGSLRRDPAQNIETRIIPTLKCLSHALYATRGMRLHRLLAAIDTRTNTNKNMSALDNWTINRILEGNRLTSRHYLGCYAANNMPSVHRFTFSMVLNKDPLPKKGSHWLAIYAPNSYAVWFFDAFGDPPPEGPIKDFIDSFSTKAESTRVIQSPLTEVCGHHCIYFIVMCSQGRRLDEIVRDLTLLDNPDMFVAKYVREMCK